jgi:hypothetical protein
METIITRDSDIVREYIAALDARERGLSPFGRLAATVKFAGLRQELAKEHLETTHEDLEALNREIDERLNRNLVRRIESRRWGARIVAFLTIVVGQQLALAAVLAVTALFVRFAPIPARWNKLLPHDDPAFLAVFCFMFFFATPLLALLVLSGGNYLRSFRVTVPITLGLIGLSILGTYLVLRGKPNPVLKPSSLSQLARDRGINVLSYNQWVDEKWLLKDPKFQTDYERFLRNGPGRWVTSRIGADDASWQNGLHVINEYLDGGSDPNSFRAWLKYYMDRNRIYSEDRLDEEVRAFTDSGDQRLLGIWQVQPFLKERDERDYRAYLGSINRSLKRWGLAELGLLALILIAAVVLGPMLTGSRSPRLIGRFGGRSGPDGDLSERAGEVRISSGRYSFPEKKEITSPPFFDTPFKILSRVHRSFITLSVSAVILAFALWGVVYAASLGSANEDVGSQTALMRDYLIFGGYSGEPADAGLVAVGASNEDAAPGQEQPPFNYASMAIWPPAIGGDSALPKGQAASSILNARLLDVEQRLDDNDFDTAKKIKDLNRLVISQAGQIETLRILSQQMQQSATPLPQQLQDLDARTAAAEDRAAQALGDVAAAKQQVAGLDKQVSAKVEEADSKATHAAEAAAKVAEDTSTLMTRAEALEKELDRRARQIEAQTEELGNRTTSLKTREDELNKLESIAFGSILSEMREETQDLDKRSQSSIYRVFNKGEARQLVQSLQRRIGEMAVALTQMKSKETQTYLTQLDELSKQVEAISKRVK